MKRSLKRSSRNKGFIMQDVGIILVSVLAAFLLVYTGALKHVIAAVGGATPGASFIAGFFFTSVFTTAPAVAALGTIAEHQNMFVTALFGAAGAMLGDMLI